MNIHASVKRANHHADKALALIQELRDGRTRELLTNAVEAAINPRQSYPEQWDRLSKMLMRTYHRFLGERLPGDELTLG